MGLKDAAKALMEAAGVPVVPGYHGAEQDPAYLAERAAEIGYPVLIKARAGGGGKGMRLVEKAGDFGPALDSARREAEAAFGDPACLIEKYVASPRHIEIQVFADAHGNVVHLFERDCSLQRRHQKVIEEAPAPGMTDAVRAAMGRAAVEAARAVGYVGAGTVEFIADGSAGLREDGFWFMEMNTRLQVEHPVSEAVTGRDFVDLQLRIAAGEPLPFTQADLSIDGWAVEARLYAEDAAKGFLPATGVLDHLAFPDAAAFERAPLRIDSGVRAGDAISPWYDPMIAKVIAHGPTRAAALARLAAALADCHVAGATTNLAFLGALARHEGFVAGAVDTGLIARDLDALIAAPPPPPFVIAAAAIAGLGLAGPRKGADPWDALAGWRHWSEARQHIALDHDGDRLACAVSVRGEGRFGVERDGETLDIALAHVSADRYRAETGGVAVTLSLVVSARRVAAFHDGRAYVFALPDALAADEAEQQGGDAVIAPMPGLVKLVAATPGAAVSRGDALMVLEAMKMEHALTAPRDGVVAEVLAAEGDQVAEGALLLTLAPEDG
jgi:3-methylcrotonyl-CoA carboxylase alpha subunit